jgi:PAS domain-containing protein
LKNEPSGVTPRLIAIPSSDPGFNEFIQRIAAEPVAGPDILERRLKRTFPRVVVRERTISGEPRAWYVYRDGGWRPSEDGEWWEDESLPRVAVTPDGFLSSASPTAAGLLGFDPAQAGEHHFTDFILPGTLDDSVALFTVVLGGDPITATMLLRSTKGDVIAVDLHASRTENGTVGVFKLAQDVDVAPESTVVRPVSVVTKPATDVAFRAYVLRALARMPEPTVDGLALRVRRLYPHAVVEGAGQVWAALREPHVDGRVESEWWRDPALPHVRFDAQALILEANEPARAFFGHELVGHHWQDFVTAGTTDEVAVMLEILGEVGGAESRFRMPRGDGTLIEFDCYTTVDGEEMISVMRPAGA